MNEEEALELLQEIPVDIGNIKPFEIAQFLDLISFIKKEDYKQAVDFVKTREKLKQSTDLDRFKYLCGSLQRVKKTYHYQNKYGKSQ